MKTHTRRPVQEQEPEIEDSFLFELDDDDVDLESLSDEELEDLLFDEPEQESRGLFALPTIAGLSLILVGVGYIFQELGLWSSGFDFGTLVGMLPWLAGILIILLGFGVLSWGPKRRKKEKQKIKVKKAVETKAPEGKKKRVVVEKVKTPPKEIPSMGDKRKRLIKSRDKKLAGVCAGIGEYFNLDPTLVRIAFVIGTVATQGGFMLAYLLLSFIMPNPEPVSNEERITIIRDT
jgi:phage shock protein C